MSNQNKKPFSRELDEEELSKVIDVYNVWAARWNFTELDHTKPLQGNDLFHFVWGRRSGRNKFVLDLSVVAPLEIRLETGKWDTWANTGLLGKLIRVPLVRSDVKKATIHRVRR